MKAAAVLSAGVLAVFAASAGGAGQRGSALPQLTLRQLSGQRVIYSYRGLTPPASLIARIQAGEAAGVIFFADNIAGARQLRAVATRLQRAAARSPVKAPLLLMTDQEGGAVRRLPGPPVLSAKQVGAAADPVTAARQAGRGAGLNLRAAGLNVNLAPVLDVYRRSGNFIDRFGRSYSRDARKVAKLGAAFIAAQQGTGVAADAKHFPGLGAAGTNQDTDARPVALHVPLARLRATDELPYRSAIASGVRLVMVSWAVYPALDARRPAGLSPTVVQGELRRRLGFAGVTITDALGAGALRNRGGVGARAVQATQAGMDLLLCASRRADEGSDVVAALANALRRRRLDEAAVRASVERVLALRAAQKSRGA